MKSCYLIGGVFQNTFAGFNLASLDIATTLFCILLLVFMFFFFFKLIITMWNDIAMAVSYNDNEYKLCSEIAKKEINKQTTIVASLKELKIELEEIQYTLKKISKHIADKQKGLYENQDTNNR